MCLAEIQEALAAAVAFLGAAVQTKIEFVINQVGQLRLIRDSVAGAGQGRGGEGYGGDGSDGGRLVNPKECKVGNLPDEAKLLDFNHWVAQWRCTSTSPADGVEPPECCATCDATTWRLTTPSLARYCTRSPTALSETTQLLPFGIGLSTSRPTSFTLLYS